MKFTLGECQETVQAIADNGMPEKYRARSVEIAKGNPGAITNLIRLKEILGLQEFGWVLSILEVKKITGSDLHVFLKRDDIKDHLQRSHWI